MSIPDPVLPAGPGDIPQSVAGLADTMEAPEAVPLLISFSRYNSSECEVDRGQMEVYAWDALRQIKRVGTQPGTPAEFNFGGDHIINAGEYRKLFKGLDDPEIDMREIKLSGKRKRMDYRGRKPKEVTETVGTGRIFFYVIDRTLYLVAIRANHYETDKIRG